MFSSDNCSSDDNDDGAGDYHDSSDNRMMVMVMKNAVTPKARRFF